MCCVILCTERRLKKDKIKNNNNKNEKKHVQSARAEMCSSVVHVNSGMDR